MSKEKQILHLYADHYSQRRIADTVHVSRNTVASVIAAAVRENLSAADAEKLDETILDQRLFPEKAMIPVQLEPEYDRIHKELLRSGVNLRLLWEEYVDACRESKQPPYMYSQFCKKYADYVSQHRLTMHIQHKPGDKLMVDWAGTKLRIYDQMQSEPIDCFLFVAALPFSMYCYAEACLTMQEEDWINAHIHMFEYFGGSARILVSDNLKAGVNQKP
jgi:transposase